MIWDTENWISYLFFVLFYLSNLGDFRNYEIVIMKIRMEKDTQIEKSKKEYLSYFLWFVI